nr:unnamed protein product [Spirometra erinaceieuropaei]
MEELINFKRELKSLLEIQLPVSKQKMASITHAAINALNYYKHVVQIVEQFILKCPPEYKVPGLYAMDAIIRQSKQLYRDKDPYGQRFMRNITHVFKSLNGCLSKDRPMISRVLQLWKKANVFPPELILTLHDLVENPDKNISPPPASSLSKAESHKVDGEAGNPAVPEEIENNGSNYPPVSLDPPTDLEATLQLLDRMIREQTSLVIQGQMIRKEAVLLLQSMIENLRQNTDIDPNLLGQLHNTVEIVAQTRSLQEQLHAARENEQNAAAQLSAQEKLHTDRDLSPSSFHNLKQDPSYQSKPDNCGKSNVTQQPPENPPPNAGYQDRCFDEITSLSPRSPKAPSSRSRTGSERHSSAVIANVVDDVQERRRRPRPASPSSTFDAVTPEPKRSRHSDTLDWSGSNVAALDSSPGRSTVDNQYSPHPAVSALPSAAASSSPVTATAETESQQEKRRQRAGLPELREGHVGIVSRTIFVGHLHKQLMESRLQSLCESASHGKVIECNFIPPRGCAFVTFDSRKAADRALRTMDRSMVEQREVKTAWAANLGVKRQTAIAEAYWSEKEGCTYLPVTEVERMSRADFDSLLEGHAQLDVDSLNGFSSLKERLLKPLKPASLEASTPSESKSNW